MRGVYQKWCFIQWRELTLLKFAIDSMLEFGLKFRMGFRERNFGHEKARRAGL
ncbi:hypothetical protein ACVWVZ_000145 [Pseudomonas tolaasii]